jgi:predicted DCC family thiol-disulfide oxidoreductase YuxK
MTTVIYDSDCSLCTRVKVLAEALDWLGTMRWIPNCGDQAAAYGIPREMLDHSVYLVSGGGTRSGFAAVQGIAARLPVTWLGAAWLIARRPWTALLFGFLLSPLARPAGEPAYQWVARNRHRLPGSTCDNRIK